MADTSPPTSPSKTIIFVRRTGSTMFLWLLVGAVFASRWSWAYLALIGLLSILAAIEYFRMLRVAGVECFPKFGIGLAAVYSLLLLVPLSTGRPPAHQLEALGVFIAVSGSFILQLRKPVRGVTSLTGIATTVLGFAYITVLFGFLGRLIFLIPGDHPVSGRIGDSGAFLLLWLLAVTKFTDMGAYLTGSMIGRHKMIPHISPGKTWEGFVGALVFAQVAACGLYAWFPGPLSLLGGWSHVLVLGSLLAVLAVLGDLAESVVKRALDAKDSGRMLPGIGGALDLIDSVCFTAPAAYFYLTYFLPAAQ